ncbi:MAG: MFS transporter [Deltaproteobacteria bacterium]|nr:MFS transporter [Deltaproteobacteria bacterium]
MRDLPRNVWALGVVSLLTDFASEMCVPLFPLLLAALGSGATWLGAMEGAADAVSALVKLAGGRLSDRLPRRKPLVLAGYALAALVRPFYAWAAAPWQVLALRASDRVGKGLRTAPRDALLADAVPPERRAEAYGLHRAFDHAGAVLGPLVAAAVLAWRPDLDVVRWVFLISLVPGVLSVVAVALGVREEPRLQPAAHHAVQPAPPGRGAVLLLALTAWFAVFRLPEVLFLARLSSLGAGGAWLPLAWSAMHVVKSATGRPMGAWADRAGPERALPLGYALYGVTVLWAFSVHDARWLLAAMLVFALHHGLTEGVEKALLSRLWPPESRGTGFGVYHGLVALLALPAGAGQGWLLEHVGAQALGSVLAAGAAVAFLGAKAASARLRGAAP